MARRPNSTTTAFLDVLFNTILGFFILLILTMVLVNPKAKNKTEDISLKAEIVVSISWPDNNTDDVDLLVQIPTGDIVFFRKKEAPLANLDRDDTGVNSDVIVIDGVRTISNTNWENVTIRKKIAGKYVVNVLMYNKREDSTTPVNIKVIGLNPFRLIHQGKVFLDSAHQEETAVVFQLDGNGNVVNKHSNHTSLIEGNPYEVP